MLSAYFQRLVFVACPVDTMYAPLRCGLQILKSRTGTLNVQLNHLARVNIPFRLKARLKFLFTKSFQKKRTSDSMKFSLLLLLALISLHVYFTNAKRIEPVYLISTIAGGSFDDNIQAVDAQVFPNGLVFKNGDESQLYITGLFLDYMLVLTTRKTLETIGYERFPAVASFPQLLDQHTKTVSVVTMGWQQQPNYHIPRK